MSDFLDKKLKERDHKGNLRSLGNLNHLIDFYSNDYLSLARSEKIRKKIIHDLETQQYALGATGSRLISGNSLLLEQTEDKIAEFHHVESALLFNSGYDANIGLLSSVPQKGDTVICDSLIHASLIDGIKLSFANKFNYLHNDLNNLESKLKNAKGNIFIVTESIFSMDGDATPLKDILKLSKKYGAHLIVDEAHALGIYGRNGSGIANKLGIEHEIFARIVTYGKAMGAHGAAILSSKKLKSYLINFARSFVYSTALPSHSIAHINAAYAELASQDFPSAISHIIKYFKKSAQHLEEKLIESHSCIQSIIIPGNQNCIETAIQIQHAGFAVKAILSPTVPVSKERIRICLHLHNTPEQIDQLITALTTAIPSQN